MVDNLFQILVWWVTISDCPFSVSRHHLLYSKKLREFLSIFTVEGDATGVGRRDGINSCSHVHNNKWCANIQSNVQVLIRQNLNLSTEELNKGSLIKSGGPGFALNEQEKKGSRGSFCEGKLHYKTWALILKLISATNLISNLIIDGCNQQNVNTEKCSSAPQ